MKKKRIGPLSRREARCVQSGGQHVVGTPRPNRDHTPDAVMPCRNGCPAADLPGRSVTMAYRESASPAQGPPRKSETETSRYAVIQSSSIKPPYSPALIHSARSHVHSSGFSGIPAQPAYNAGVLWSSLARKHPSSCIYTLFCRRGALASSFLLPTLIDALSSE